VAAAEQEPNATPEISSNPTQRAPTFPKRFATNDISLLSDKVQQTQEQTGASEFWLYTKKVYNIACMHQALKSRTPASIILGQQKDLAWMALVYTLEGGNVG
jgi:hypothetical protein